MEVLLTNIGKRYSKDWVIKDVSLKLEAGSHTAILGGNGSGKSTLLKIISGYLSPSKGELTYQLASNNIEIESVYESLSFVAPYQDIYQQMTFSEILDFHFSLRKFKEGSSKELILNSLDLPANSVLTSFSSGMLQRVKLAIAFHSDSKLLLFDEPTMNLDQAGSEWFASEVNKLSADCTVVIASNLPGLETKSCSAQYKIQGKQLISS